MCTKKRHFKSTQTFPKYRVHAPIYPNHFPFDVELCPSTSWFQVAVEITQLWKLTCRLKMDCFRERFTAKGRIFYNGGIRAVFIRAWLDGPFRIPVIFLLGVRKRPQRSIFVPFKWLITLQSRPRTDVWAIRCNPSYPRQVHRKQIN